MTTDCLFCRIVAGSVPATRVAENAYCLAFRDINPQAPTHILVIPRAHFASIDDVTEAAVIGEVMLMAADVARMAGVADAGYRIVLNTGDDGGQTVHHLHAHVLGGRAMHWPPG